ncbi:13268_t:CDS:1 [Gigaspora margarita]|uniref:Poly [ADP-ribose] polymerase n=1 Tax=Gigaspora margarita TaxID=4874 RepID=A0ABN7WGE8_GIGMA|nr:13268_t:CDS:1 [Gigaspora margarita]
MSSILNECCITFSGIFAAGNHAKLSATVKEHGATVSSKFTQKTTHLVATNEDYLKNSSKVLTAKEKNDISIVTWDWVKDSINEKCRKNESDYVPSEVLSDDVDMNDASINSGKRKIDNTPESEDVTLSRKKSRVAKHGDNSITCDLVNSVTTITVNDQIGEVIQVVEEKKMVKIIKKGKAPVDELFRMKDSYHVFSNDQATWDCLLNQTNAGSNNNKYFIIQLLESDAGANYYVYSRWGRVGYDGQQAMLGPWTSLDTAKYEFEKKFRDKTKNKWMDVCQDQSNFKAVKGKYTLLERDYGDDAVDVSTKNKAEVSPPPSIPESKLHPKIQDVIKMIFDVNLWNDAMVELNYDASKLPLGKLSKSTITRGYEILRSIEAVLINKEDGDLVELSNDFYTVIPHNFGFNKPPIINNIAALKTKMAMVEALGEIEIASSLIKNADISKNPLDSNHDLLGLERMVPLDHDSAEFKLILNYVKNTQGITHHIKLEIIDVFDIERQGERERYKPYSKLHNRMLLWHGSRRTNYVGILSQGLRIAPPHAPVTGYMFGKGVYFADCASKSANYCNANYGDKIGFMLLCEVACGDMLELIHGDYDAGENVRKKRKHCTKGLGQIIPDPKGAVYLENGTMIPCGKGMPADTSKSLYYNEYIVYDVDQIFQKYLLKVKFGN